jgi:hypothetical protein
MTVRTALASALYLAAVSAWGQVPDTHWLSIPAPAGSSGGDLYGATVAISGTRFAVGAPSEDTGATDAGSVMVHDLAGGSAITPFLTLHHPHPAAGDQFGAALAMSGSRIVVGAPFHDTGATNAGRAYVFDLSSPTPAAPLAVLNNPGPAVNDKFGSAVAVSGDIVIVGAPEDDTGASNAGIAYVFDLSSATPTTPVHTLMASGAASFDLFGSAVAASGTRVAVVASYRDQVGYPDKGDVFIYDLAGPTPTTPVKLLSSYSSVYPYDTNNIGGVVAMSGTQVVTSPNATGTEPAFRYDIAQPFVGPVSLASATGPSLSEKFGSAVALSGGTAVVGERGLGYTSHPGKAYVYPPASSRVNLTNPSPNPGDQFGASAAIDNHIVVIGAPYDDTTATDQGAVHVFGPLDGDADGLRDVWEVMSFGATTGHGPLDDHDKDGYVELLELGLGLNPTISNAGGHPGLTQEGGYLTMTLTKQPGVTYQVQTAGSLITGQPDSFSAASTTVLINNATTLKVRDNVLMGGAAARFIRVQVTGTP